jgi:hypothetical protein
MTGFKDAIPIDPKDNGTMPCIKELWLFVATDEATGDEGCIAMDTPIGPQPMIAADEKRLNSLRPMAEAAARQSGTTVRLVKFSDRSVVEEFSPYDA